MAQGIKALRYIQLGQETTAGSEVNATTLWCGVGAFEDRQGIEEVNADVAIMSGDGTTYTAYELGAIAFEPTPATFEQIGYIFTAGIKNADGVADGSGSGYTYTYTLPTTAANTVDTYTIEAGDNAQEEQMLYSFVESFNLSGKSQEAVMVSANWLGRDVATGTKTASQVPPDDEQIIFGKAVLYIDAVSGTFGTTTQSKSLLAFNIDVVTGVQPLWSADGSLQFAGLKYTAPEITMDLTFEHDTSSIAQKAAAVAETPKLIRIKIEGSSLTTGDTYTYKTLIIDLAGHWSAPFDALGEIDGNSVVTGHFKSHYDLTETAWGQFLVVTEASALV